MAKPAHGYRLQAVGILFVLLLAGGEASRVARNLRASAGNVIDEADSNGELTAFPHHRVCRHRDFRNIDRGIQRYRYKMQRLKSLVDRLEQPRCIAEGCVRDWIELKARMSHFTSCSKLMEDSGMPDAFHAVLSHGDDALVPGLVKPLRAADDFLRSHNVFPVFEDLPHCGFTPSNLSFDKVAAANQSVTDADVLKKLFGDACGEKAQVRQYVRRLSGPARLIADSTVQRVKQAYAIKREVEAAQREGATATDPESLPEVEEIADKLEVYVDELQGDFDSGSGLEAHADGYEKRETVSVDKEVAQEDAALDASEDIAALLVEIESQHTYQQQYQRGAFADLTEFDPEGNAEVGSRHRTKGTLSTRSSSFFSPQQQVINEAYAAPPTPAPGWLAKTMPKDFSLRAVVWIIVIILAVLILGILTGGGGAWLAGIFGSIGGGILKFLRAVFHVGQTGGGAVR